MSSDIVPHGQLRFETSAEHCGAITRITVEVDGVPVADLSWAVGNMSFKSPPRSNPTWIVELAADFEDPTHLTMGGPR
jgi:hypothetical protein